MRECEGDSNRAYLECFVGKGTSGVECDKAKIVEKYENTKK